MKEAINLDEHTIFERAISNHVNDFRIIR